MWYEADEFGIERRLSGEAFVQQSLSFITQNDDYNDDNDDDTNLSFSSKFAQIFFFLQ